VPAQYRGNAAGAPSPPPPPYVVAESFFHDAALALQLNIAYPPCGTQKKLEIEDDAKL
jgi:hypothetical protein